MESEIIHENSIPFKADKFHLLEDNLDQQLAAIGQSPAAEVTGRKKKFVPGQIKNEQQKLQEQVYMKMKKKGLIRD